MKVKKNRFPIHESPTYLPTRTLSIFLDICSFFYVHVEKICIFQIETMYELFETYFNLKSYLKFLKNFSTVYGRLGYFIDI